MQTYDARSNYVASGSISLPPAGRELRVPVALDDVQHAIERLEKTSEELSMRLDKVCGIQPTSKNMVDSAPIQNEAPLVAELFKKAEAIRNVCERLDDLMNRLEV